MQVLIALWMALAGTLTVPQDPPPAQAGEVLAQLSKIRLDKGQIHSIRDVTIRRDVLAISFTNGTIAFLEPVMGKVTGAVFVGTGEVVAIPPDAVERQQVDKFTGSPVLNEPFRAAVFRFTDDTFAEITKEIAEHAHEDVAEEDAALLAPLELSLAERSGALNFRILADLMEAGKQPLFLAELDGNQTGKFNVALDSRVAEEVTVFAAADIWASFHQRSEARNPEAVAHETKRPFDVLSYDIDATLAADNRADWRTDVHLRSLNDGQRVLSFRLSRQLQLSAVSLIAGEAVAFYQNASAEAAIAVLPRPLNAGQEITLRFVYAGNPAERRLWYPDSGIEDRAAFHMTFHYPAGSALVATGSRVREWDEGGLQHSAWKSDGELPVAGFAMAGTPGLPGTSLAYFTTLLGPYPYGMLNVREAAPAEPAAPRSWPSLIELPANADATKSEWILAQEIARQWIGHAITPAGYRDRWLFEALPRYLAAMYIENLYPDSPRFREILNESRTTAIDNDGAGPIWLGPRLTTSVAPGAYQAVPNKGVWILHMLRMLMRQAGADPDAAYTRMLRDLVASYRDKAVSTWDVKRLIEKHGGREMDWFFDEWVFATGIPLYGLDYNVEPARNEFVISGVIRQSGVPEGFTMPVPVYADSELLGRVETNEFRFTVAKKPERVVLDPFETVLRKP